MQLRIDRWVFELMSCSKIGALKTPVFFPCQQPIPVANKLLLHLLASLRKIIQFFVYKKKPRLPPCLRLVRPRLDWAQSALPSTVVMFA